MTDAALPNAKILETTLIPNAGGSVVRIQISDGSLDPASYSMRLDLSVAIQHSALTALAQIEHDAMNFANSVLAELVRQKEADLKRGRQEKS